MFIAGAYEQPVSFHKKNVVVQNCLNRPQGTAIEARFCTLYSSISNLWFILSLFPMIYLRNVSSILKQRDIPPTCFDWSMALSECENRGIFLLLS
jgi:hypothetical protein